MSYKVLFDGNGSGIIQAVGVGLYVPAEKHNEVMQKWEQAQAERDALAAKNELCNDALKSLLKTPLGIGGSLQSDGQFYYKVPESVFKKAESAFATAPSQCLRDVQAEAVLKFAKYIAETGELNFGDSNLILSEGFTYSQSVRQGGAE